MKREEIPIPEKSKEKEPKEVSRYELDPQKGIDVVVKTAPDVGLWRGAKLFKYEAAKIILEQKGKTILDFKEFLPKRYNIAFVDRGEEKREKRFAGNVQNIWEHDFLNGVVLAPRKWDEKAKDVLAVLHEIAHSLNEDEPEKRQQSYHWFDIIDKIESLGVEEYKGTSFKKARREYLKLNSELERFAWAKALSIARNFKRKKGIDLLKSFQGKKPEETRKNLEEYIHGIHSLGAAEKWLVGGRPFEEEFKGIFTTKYYKGKKFTPKHRKKIRGKG